MIYRFDTISSTNDEAAKAGYVEGDVVCAECQTAGRGQRGHSWESGVGLNLTFSIVFEPRFLPPTKQFLLSEAVALGVRDMLSEYGIEAQIKWTNDIYVGNQKIAGILIEHKLQSDGISRTVAGIGLNVNQMEFSSDLPNPVSMAQVSRRRFDRDNVLQTLIRCQISRYEQLRSGDEQRLQADYHHNLYRRDRLCWYALPDGSRFRGTILGVESTGALRIANELGQEYSYLFKEVEFVLND